MKSPFTPRQGQFLVFIHQYTSLHGRPPAEAEMVQFFRVTPPTVHQMILTLERRGLITRTPGQARSIKLRLPAESLPSLQSGDSSAEIHPPLGQTGLADEQAALITRLGRIQIEDLFAHNRQNPLNDAEFIPLLNTLIESFARAGLSAMRCEELRRLCCELHHQHFKEVEPESTFEANTELMLGHLPSPARTRWRR